MQTTNSQGELAVTSAPWAPSMKKDYPEIKEYTRLLKDDKVLIVCRVMLMEFISKITKPKFHFT